jgi:hypothetical protein
VTSPATLARRVAEGVGVEPVFSGILCERRQQLEQKLINGDTNGDDGGGTSFTSVVVSHMTLSKLWTADLETRRRRGINEKTWYRGCQT